MLREWYHVVTIGCVCFFLQVESELAGLAVEDRNEFLGALGVTDEECGLKVRLILYFDC